MGTEKATRSMKRLPDYVSNPATLSPYAAIGLQKRQSVVLPDKYREWAGYAYSAVAIAYGLNDEVLMNERTRIEPYAEARQAVMYVLRNHYNIRSLKTIARLMDGYDHTTIIAGLKRMQGFIDVYPDVRSKMDEIVSILSQ